MPYYYGIERLCAMATNNVEELLSLAAVRPPIPEKTERAIPAALSKKELPGLRKLAAIHGVGVGTVQRISRELHSGTNL